MGQKIGFKYTIGNKDQSHQFGDLLDDGNFEEIIKEKYVGVEINHAIKKANSNFPSVEFEEWQQIVMCALQDLLEEHRMFDYVGDKTHEARSKQFCSFLRKYLYLRMLNYINTYKGIDLTEQNDLNPKDFKTESEEFTEERVLESFEVGDVEDALNELSPENRYIIEEVVIKFRPQREVAKELNVTQQYISKKKIKNLEKLVVKLT